MTETLYKATHPHGTDFYTRKVKYAAACGKRTLIHHPTGELVPNEPSTYLSVSVSAADTLIGGSWPCRLFRVEARGQVLSELRDSPNIRAVATLKVVEELPAWQALGPNGEAVVALIERARRLTRAEMDSLGTARYAAWNAARYAALNAARDAARVASWNAARYAARDAALDAARDATRVAAESVAWLASWDAAWGAAVALIVRDLLPREHYDVLVGPWAAVTGKAHPDD